MLRHSLPAFLLLGLLTASARAVPTDITVRVISKGAKFVGTSLGGARVIIRDADTQAILAEGVTMGSTGDTDRIMREAHARGAHLATEGSARFETTLDLEEPRRIEVIALGPLAQPQASNRASVTQWVVPGKHISGGDGFLLELPGFVVDVLSPAAHMRLKGLPQEVSLSANVTMMCGCPLTPGGLWDSNQFEVRALLQRDGEPAGTIDLEYAGTASQFKALWKIDSPGNHMATVYAYDPSNGNTGLDHVTLIVQE